MSHSTKQNSAQRTSPKSKQLLMGAAVGAGTHLLSYAIVFIVRHVIIVLSSQLPSEAILNRLPYGLNLMLLFTALIVVQKKTGQKYLTLGLLLGWIVLSLLFSLIMLFVIS